MPDFKFIWEQVLVPYWWKFLPALIAAAIALFQLWLNRQGKQSRSLWTLACLYVAAAAATCAIIWFGERDARRAAAKAEETNTQLRDQLDRIEGRQGSEEATKRFLDAQRTLIDLLVKDKTETAVEKFFSSVDERRRMREAVDSVNRRLLATYQIQFQPVYDLVLKTFDAWLASAKERGLSIDVSTTEFDPVSIGATGTQTPRIAQLTDARLILYAHAAAIEDARLSTNLRIRIRFSNTRGENRDYLTIVLADDEYILGNHQKAKCSFDDYQGAGNMPMSDPKFLDAISVGLNQVMAFVLEQTTMGQASSDP